ncbi:MAG: hypothetical protein ACOWW1_00655 [archaeon]
MSFNAKDFAEIGDFFYPLKPSEPSQPVRPLPSVPQLKLIYYKERSSDFCLAI